MSETWHEIGPAEDVPVGTLRRIEVAGTAVCIGRASSGWVAFQDTCTHENCSLADGSGTSFDPQGSLAVVHVGSLS